MEFWKLLILALIFGEIKPSNLQQYTIGVMGQKWYRILSKILVNRKVENRIILKQLTANFSIPFYENMKSNFQQLQKLSINLVIGDSSWALAQTASHLKIPYISTDSYLYQSNDPEYSNMPHFYSLLIPDKIYSIAVLDNLNKFCVRTASVIIDSSVDYDSFMKPLFDQKSINIRIWTLTDDVTQDIRKLPKKLDQILEESREINIWDFVVKAEIKVVKIMILRAKYYGMLVEPNKWYLPSFLCHDINIAAIRQIHSNITMINEECSESMLRQNNNYSDIAVINKAVQIFRMVDWELTSEKLNQALKLGQTGMYDVTGQQIKSRFSLHSLNVDETLSANLVLVGVWMYKDNKSSLNYFFQKSKSDEFQTSSNFHIRVSAVEEHPHLINLGNDSYEGYGVDILSELSKSMNFTYSIHLTNSIGSKDNSNWTGIVGEILSDRADMSLGPLVQTKEIEEVLDFSTSFKQREISLVIRKSTPSTTLFQFFSPFSSNVWIICVSALVVVTLVMWVLEYFHDSYFPNDYPFPLNLKESSWVAIACLLKQQMDIFPTSIPGRIIHFFIIFFSLIIITSYTANLAAFLTIKESPNLVNKIEDLANLPPNSQITFGTVKESPILEFFEQSKVEKFRKVFASMKSNPHWLVNDSGEGYRRALSEPYVFIWDDSVNQYEISTENTYECKLITIGKPFGKRSFAIGLKNGSELMEKLNLNILHLIESGINGNLEKKWWDSKSPQCVAKDSAGEDQEELTLEELSGVFLIVVMGAILSTGWLIGQIIIYKLKEHKKREIQKAYLKNEICNHGSASEPLKKEENGYSQC